MSQEHIGQLAGLISLIAFMPYILSILKGETKPSRTTFAIWTFVDAVTLASYFATGARATIWVVLAFTSLQSIVFILSFRYGVGGKSRFDVMCLTGAAIGLSLWAITRNPATALYFSILAETIGYLPVIKKSYLTPKTESTPSWALSALGAAVNLFAITTWRTNIALYPIVIFVADGLVAAILIIRKFRINSLETSK